MQRLIPLVLVLAASLGACASVRTPIAMDRPPADLTVSAASLYRQYGDALKAGRRSAIADFYHPQGALIVFNGVPRRQSRDELRQQYLTFWSPPDFFEWEGLTFDSISTSQVIVTGGFRWKSAGQPDTARFIYAAVVAAVDSGMAIVFEHETVRPPQ